MANGAGRIDVHHHFYPPDYRPIMGPYAQMPQVRDWKLERTVEEMEKNNVDAAMLSLREQGLAAALRIQAIPTLMVFRDGVLLFREAGLLPEPALEDLVEQVRGIDMDEVKKEIALADA